MQLAMRGEMGPATGWLGRAHRLLEGEGECAEQGYLLMPVAFQHDQEGDIDGASATAATAAEIGERFGDRDLFALAIHSQGEFLVNGGRVREGLGLLDEAMVAVTEGGLSPIVTGIVYCGMILACEQVYELRRAKEWTAALARWCEQQPDLIAFTGRCHVHRAQLMRLQGRWPDALEELQRAGRPATARSNQDAAARACCLELAEIADRCDSDLLRALLADARGAVEWAAGDAAGALPILREAFQAWQRLEAPYEAARTRVLVGRACRALGDEDGFAFELEAAREAFEYL